MKNIFGLFGDDENSNSNSNSNNNSNSNSNNNSGTNNSASNNITNADQGKLTLHQEELDINKNTVQTGEVTLKKEVVEEQKSVDVPVTHEEVVIERKCLNNEPCEASIGCDETVSIPVTEEQVNVSKHTVATGEVSAYKHQIDGTQQVQQTLRKEEARVEKSGNPQIADNSGNSNQSMQ